MNTKLPTRIAGCGLAALTSIAGLHADAVATPPPDDAMTCEQIAMELSGYGQQMMPNLQAFAASQSQLNQQAMQKGKQRMVEESMLLPLAEAGAIDPTGAAKRAYQAAVIAQQAKERAENEAMVNSPLAKQNKAHGEQVAAQAQQMQSDARLQRLLQLGQEKHCDKR